MSKKITYQATITCPKCGFSQKERMPVQACQHFYQCASCGETLSPTTGKCCVFCSYADAQCPPKQLELSGGQTN